MIHKVSLETAKLLKENGFRKECHFGYCDGELECNPSPTEWPIYAPTTDELLEELPWHTQIYKGTDGNLGQYICHLDARSVIGQKETKWFYHKDLCEALAQMWLYLKKEGLLNDNK